MTIILPVAPSSFAPSFSTAAFNAPRERFAMTPISALLALGARCTRAEILTYTALELHADKNTGFCNPGRETLAAITGLPENRITKATTSLEKKGFIRKEQPDPFHVHYFLLTPPAIEPVEPKARFRPPVKLHPVQPAAAQPSMEPASVPPMAPAAPVVPPAEPTSCHQRHELVPPAAPLTDQWTDQKEKREATPEPAAPEPAAVNVPPAGAPSRFVIQTKNVLPDDWQLPNDWREWANKQRPDLAGRLDVIASNFADYHASKGTRSASWIAEWRRWVNREHAPKATQNAPQATNAPSRYAHLDLPMKPLDAAMKAAYEQSEQRRLDQLRAAGIDPATGFPVAAQPAAAPVQPTPAQPKAPTEPGDLDNGYEAWFQRRRQEQLKRLQEMMEARERQNE